MEDKMRKKELLLCNASGLHARPATVFIEKAKTFQSKLTIQLKGSEVAGNAKSIITLLALGAGLGDTILLTADGTDEEEAIKELSLLIESGFGEV